MSIQIGDRIPDCTISMMMENGPAEISTQAYFKGRKVVLFAVPGAFTPTCSAYHLPGYVEHLAEFAGKGVDAVACMSVNDVFVMDAWGKSAKADGIDMLADGNGEFAHALGLELDSRAFGMGMRSQRFALVAEDGVVSQLMIEAPGEFRVSSAEAVLASL
jgi:peroxiredoxin